ncbi:MULTISPECIES: hypothetical protein [unclassified Pseudoxanthomonas]|nr:MULTISPECIES: hypothetical protein [unclassified Pseudoxanthomonas]MBB3277502.1 flagellar biosynthesis/type III secretory pathway M-ring protein FliF/YscJ [Pseudoxanthomonas sp. OG2]MBD9376305.1 hypothetical protein [Pseudoxanthomonas sp. PXM04]MBV7474174.1 hypothetical protein [Pseudoxanthomonas sp. PXM05]UBB26254.1 hypothetical protein LAG73_03975 [Pseudoxanthomonas japonensis]
MFEAIAQLLAHWLDLFGQAGSRRAWPIMVGLLLLISILCAVAFWTNS